MELNKEIILAFGFESSSKHANLGRNINFVCDLNLNRSYFLIQPVKNGPNPFQIEVVGGEESMVMKPKTIRTVRALNQYMADAALHLGSQARAHAIREALNSPDIFSKGVYVDREP